jgi:IS5 family transposase
MAGLHLLKHMKGLSDEELCAAWLENLSIPEQD